MRHQLKQNVQIFTGHNVIDQGVPGQEAAKELAVFYWVKKVKSTNYLQIANVKNGKLGRESINAESHKFNCASNHFADALRGNFQNTDF